ncbi:glycosyltransferase family 4 protein [Salinarchaeum laminariae]|uniref:glycosyltransferase family 4 protein n=1 Tax=Salinarchaeum laminariae TaxID=869888 RepID=UPI0020BEBEB6|nr:glycosyltransferase family 4 protein [Salinarchaeum laminariae]
MHVAILVKEFPPDVIGGTETQTRRMAAELQQRTDHDVTVYTKAYAGSESHSEYSFNLVRVPNWRLTPFVSTLTFVLVAFLYLLRDRRTIDVLQCMMIYPNGFVGYLLHRLAGLPYFAWIRGGDYYFMKETRWKRWMIDRVLGDTTVLVQTPTIERDVRSEFDPQNLAVFGNGVDLPDRLADGDEIVYVGRLEDQKGIDVLLRALEDTDETLVAVGDGSERARLMTLADELGVDAEFVGLVDPDEVAGYLRRGKIFVLPSVAGEGLPNALLEAYAHGLPAVTTDLAGLPDAVVDGETGFLVPPNSPSELRDRILQLCNDDERRQAMGASAREYVEREHYWASITARLDEIYESQ